MESVPNPIKTYFKNFSHNLKSGKLAIDELSSFLIVFSVILLIIFLLLRLPLFTIIAWIPLFISYWRTLSKNKVKRAKENQFFIKHYYPASSRIKNTYRRMIAKKDHHYFACGKCDSKLRIPKRTGHIKVTCPRCNHSFIKKTIRGHFNKVKLKMKRKFAH